MATKKITRPSKGISLKGVSFRKSAQFNGDDTLNSIAQYQENKFKKHKEFDPNRSPFKTDDANNFFDQNLESDQPGVYKYSCQHEHHAFVPKWKPKKPTGYKSTVLRQLQRRHNIIQSMQASFTKNFETDAQFTPSTRLKDSSLLNRAPLNSSLRRNFGAIASMDPTSL